ncbi:MAG: MATE family efflux transporter [Pseudomonadota bacterium]
MQYDIAQVAPRTRVGGQVRALWALGLPLVGSHVAQMLIGVTDTVMMGWHDITGLAALSVASPIFFIVFILGSGFAWAVTPIVASALGERDERQVRRVTRMGLWLSLCYGVCLVPVFFFFEPIMLAIGQEPEVARQAGIYMPYLGLGLIPALLVQVLKSYLSALELTRAILLAVIGAALMNALVNYVLIFGNFGAPELGIVGAGVASLLSHTISLVLLTLYALRKKPEHELLRNFHRPDPQALVSVFRLGVPIGLTLLAETGLFAASSVMMGWIGTIPLAAHGVALQITSISFMIPLGLSQAATVRIGKAWGRGDAAELRAAAWAGLILAGASLVLIIVTFLSVPGFLVGLFVDPTDPARPEILAVGTTLMMLAALFQLVDIGQVMALGMLRGVQDTRVPMIMAIISYWGIGMPVAYVLGFGLGMEGAGIWLGLTVGLAFACAGMQYRFWSRYGRGAPGQGVATAPRP